MTEQYDKRFDECDIIYLKGANITPEEANLYDKRFNGENIVFLKKEKITPENINSYDRRLMDLMFIKLSQ
jgi:hypothetical protein